MATTLGGDFMYNHSKPGYQRVHSSPYEIGTVLRHAQSPDTGKPGQFHYHYHHQSNDQDYDNNNNNISYNNLAYRYESSPQMPQSAFVQDPKTPYVAIEEKRTWRQRLKSHDWWALILLLSICATSIITCVVFLSGAWAFSRPSTDMGKLMTADEIVVVNLIATIPSLVSTVLNEVLVEKCWRRIQYFALSKDRFRDSGWDNAVGAENLRASNFGWWEFCKQAARCRLSGRDLYMLLTWTFLRFGTTAALASPQLCISWQSSSPAYNSSAPTFLADRRYWFVFVPPTFYMLVVFGTFAMWAHSPLAMVRSSYGDKALWEAYKPFRSRVNGGSIVSVETIAKFYETGCKDRSLLKKRHQPGMQFAMKLKGTAFGLIASFIPLGLAWAWVYTHKSNRDELWRNDKVRYSLTFAFLVQNIMYVLALDFIVWNLALEGLCRSSRTSPSRRSKVSQIAALGKSAGIMLLLNLFRRGRPRRATLLIGLSFAMACVMRLWTNMYFFAFSSIHYGSEDDQKDAYDPDFWIGYAMLSALITFVPILPWLFCSFQAPMCWQDGWRWAIISDARFGERDPQYVGDYGVDRNEHGSWARMGDGLKSFTDAGAVDLI